MQIFQVASSRSQRAITSQLFLKILPLVFVSMILTTMVVLPVVAAPGQSEVEPFALKGLARPLDTVARVHAPKVDRQAAQLEDVTRDEQGLPPRYAIPNRVFITPSTDGSWESLDPKTEMWRLRIFSAGALSLNLGFTRYRLPAGATLFVYDTHDPRNGTRAFTHIDNKEHGQLWTPVVLADDIIVELTVPIKAKQEVALALTSVNVGYRYFGEQQVDKSGACNVDVVCPEGDDWRDEIQSVAVISVGGSLNCTGFMVNNTAQDATPYFMTAAHCGLGAGNAASLVVYWNYESPNCGDQGGGSLAQSQNGSVFRAGYNPSDFTLVELDDSPDPDWDVTFAGWDHTSADPTSAVAIHHPSTDEKSISFEYDPTSTTSYYSNMSPGDGTHIRVADWDVGTTEPGSSGSPLFNQNHHVVGQLHGGLAACENDLPDWYGRFSISWSGGGTPNSRLSDWLDPLGTGTTTLDLLAPFASGLSVSPSNALVSEGNEGGPFTPGNITYTMANRSDFAIDYTVTADQAWVSISDPNGRLLPNSSAFVTVSINSNADNLAPGHYEARVTFTNITDHDGDTVRFVRLQVGTPDLIYSFPLNNEPNWTTEGNWAFGLPLGNGGVGGGDGHGSPDPTAGYTGTNVYGYNLAGNYENSMPQYHLTSTGLDCSNLTGVTLKFWRWLGVENSSWDHAAVSVSNDGTNFTPIWQNGPDVDDGSWIQQEYDISAIADGQENVFVRWTMGPTDSIDRYCGWNIDDIEFWAFDTDTPAVFLSHFSTQLEADGVVIRWDTSTPSLPSEFSLTAELGSDGWNVPFDNTGDSSFYARDNTPQLDAGGIVTYFLYYQIDEADWVLLASRSVDLDSPPQLTKLIGARPNPFNPSTTIHFDLAQTGHVKLTIYDLRGQVVKILVDGDMTAGHQAEVWQGYDRYRRAVAGGTYLYRLEANGIDQIKKMALVR